MEDNNSEKIEQIDVASELVRKFREDEIEADEMFALMDNSIHEAVMGVNK